jgi:hypothetical protein
MTVNYNEANKLLNWWYEIPSQIKKDYSEFYFGRNEISIQEIKVIWNWVTENGKNQEITWENFPSIKYRSPFESSKRILDNSIYGAYSENCLSNTKN